MKITRQDLGEMAGRILEVLERERICSLAQLNEHKGKRITVGEKEFVDINLRPSKRGTQANTLSYIVEDRGIPIGVRINPVLHYGDITVKTGGLIGGYQDFSLDGFGNLIQSKELYPSSFQCMERELKELRDRR
jgi:hypothetical protein